MDSTMTDSANRTTSEDTPQSTDPERLKLYRSAVQNCLKGICSSITSDEFIALFQQAPQYKRKTVSHYHTTLTNYVYNNVNKQVEDHIAVVKLSDKFSSLETLITQNAANKGKKRWRPSHDVNEDLRAYVIQEKKAIKVELERMVTAKEDSVNKLKDEILKDERRAKELGERLTKANDCLNTINKCLDVADKAVAS